MAQFVIVEKKDKIAIVTLNRPDKHNGLNMQLLSELIDAGKKLKKDKKVRAVILQGNGPSFCAGLDFGSVTKQPTSILPKFLKWPWQKMNDFQRVGYIWRELPMPVIAAVHGNCFGAGIQIALGADFRFATPDANISVLEMKWGLIPDMSGTIAMGEHLPLDIAKDLAMTGRFISGEEAKAMNLVTWLADDPKAAALEYAELLASKSPDAVRACKQLFTKNKHASDSEALQRERLYQMWMFATPNQKKAMKAGMKKEQAEYADRLF